VAATEFVTSQINRAASRPCHLGCCGTTTPEVGGRAAAMTVQVGEKKARQRTEPAAPAGFCVERWALNVGR
jgi:hypothetical protein